MGLCFLIPFDGREDAFRCIGERFLGGVRVNLGLLLGWWVDGGDRIIFDRRKKALVVEGCVVKVGWMSSFSGWA